MITFRHTCIIVRNLDESLKFYSGILGLSVDTMKTIEGEYPETILGIPSVKLTYVKFLNYQLELHYYHQPKIKPKMSRAHISLTVDNIDSLYSKLLEKGIGFISPPTIAPDTGNKLCFCTDPNGNFIELVEEFL